jgi:4-methoxybenzoate monooxygenase (O-demethylating)
VEDEMTVAALADVPVLDADPFSIEVLDDPYPFYTELREAGPIVYLSAQACFATGRHNEAQAVLSDHERFISSAGVGIANFTKEKPWRPPSLVLEADPPLHTRTRGVLSRILSPGTIRKLQERFEREAEILVDKVVGMGTFDAIDDLCEYYPVKVFPDAVGLRADGREHLLPYGSMVFNSFGPRNGLTEQAFVHADEVRAWIMANCARSALSKDGLGAEIYASADTGELTEEQAGMLVRSFLSAGVDTTVNSLGNMLWALMRFPSEWRKLKANPSLARNAFEESLRYEGTAQLFFRTTKDEVEFAGSRIAAKEKVAVFMGAANRDPRRWEDPDVYDISRRAAGHLTFGTGIHGCVGQQVARLEGEAILSALLRKVERIEFAGEPVRRHNNVLRCLAHMPVRVVPA